MISTSKVRSILSEKRGNVLMITGLSILPLVLATGIGIDYSRAARLQTKLNAAADAAALAAVSHPAMTGQNDTQAQTLAANVFTQQASTINASRFVPSDLSVTISSTSAFANDRVAVVRYRAFSRNFFASILGQPEIEVSGLARATATRPPNIDFYVALDSSPSMALPTTSSGIATMDAKVGCAFACHSNKIQNYVPNSMKRGLIRDNTDFAINKTLGAISGSGASQTQVISSDGAYIFTNRTTTNSLCSATGSAGGKDICVYNSDGTFVDSYWYAKNQNVELRIHAMKHATKELMDTAAQYAFDNNRTYRAALYTFDHANSFKTISSLTTSLSSIATAADNVSMSMVNDQAGNGCPMTGCQGGNRYLFTSYASVLTNMVSIMPALSGQGTNTPGDTPQAFLFLITDGMSDEFSNPNVSDPMSGSGRTRTAMRTAQVTQCNALKARGIKIAILYTRYTKASVANDEASQRALANAAIGVDDNVAPTAANSPIYQRLEQCASPGLIFTVSTDENISAALQSLFNKAVTTARLTN